MKKESLSKLISKFPPGVKTIIKDIYNKVNDVRVFDLEEINVTSDEFNKLLDLMQKINNGEDITFEIGYRYFRDNKLKLKKGVFVPQYDTEQMIDLVKERINEGTFIEVGTGTGAIPIALVKETKMTGISIDINPDATNLAKENLDSIIPNCDSLEFIEMDVMNLNLNSKFDLIISNPPYIDFDDENVEEWVKENQPKEALYAEKNGLAIYEKIFNEAKNILKPNGYIIVEIGFDQGKSVSELASSISSSTEVIKDYEQHDRFVVIRYNGN